jgi:predicted nuclease with TOPRIM domain
MAKNQPKDILSRVADLGEEALNRLPNFPGGERLMDVVNQSRTRLDEMQKRMRGLDVLEKRVDEMEQRLAKLEKPAATKSSSTKASTAKPKPAQKKPATPKKPPA